MDFKKAFNGFVFAMSVITVLLVSSLSVSLFGLKTGIIYSFLLFVFFSGIIGLGLWSQRVKRVVKSLSKDQISNSSLSHESIEIPLIESLIHFDFNPLPLLFGLIVILFVLNFQFILNDMEITFGGIVFWLNTAIILIFLILVMILKKDFSKRKNLLKKSPLRKIVFNSEGISIPFEILTQGPLQIALRNNEADVFIAWKDIKSWEIYPGGGRAPSQFSLELQGDSKKYASAFGVLGIVRIPEIVNSEELLIQYANQYLSCDIKIR